MERTKWLIGIICSTLLLPFTFAQKKEGNASYYSNKLHGRRMSNGIKYHKDSMTCAHLNYPMGTLLKVRNLTNGKEVIVKVSDRGPHTKRFIIDLSYAAAKKIGIISAGFAKVLVTPYKDISIPYKNEENDLLPEIDFEETNFDLSNLTDWKPDTIAPLPNFAKLHKEKDSKEKLMKKRNINIEIQHKTAIKKTDKQHINISNGKEND